MKPLFIVIEGIDGCGKTTQLKAIADWLPTIMPDSARLVVTREPGGTSLGTELRSLLLNSKGQAPCRNAELLLYLADRAQHVESVIKPALEAGDWVLCDRFNMSTIAYQGYGRGHSLRMIDDLQNFASAKIEPNLTLWIDISIAEAMKRTKNKQLDRIELEDIEFFQKVHSGYCAAKSLDPRTIAINGLKDIESVTQACKYAISTYIIGTKSQTL
jgi:dTMP kinase